MDGTLNMTELYAIPAYKKILEKMGAEGFTDEMLKNRIGAAFMDDIRYFFGNRAEERKEEFEELVEEYWLKDVESKAKTFPHVNQTLQELIEKGYHLAICSNAEEEEIAVNVIQLPIVPDKSSRCFAPKYWETMMPAPTEIPTNSTRSRFKIGDALPTAASALSPTYLPTITLSAVL